MKKKKIIISILMILLGVAILVYLINSKKNNTNEIDYIIGEWTTDGVTIYKFNEDTTGSLKVSLGEYDFDYKIEDNKLYIDFKNEKSEDSEYTYSISKDKLTLKGKNGEFEFKRNKTSH